MSAARSNLRLFFVGGAIAYRALFNWIRPSTYIPTMLLGPVFQILFFAYLGRYAKLRDDSFFAVGNSVDMACMAGIFAGVMVIANERQFQTLSALLATPANRLALFAGRALPVIANGLLVSAWGFGASVLLLRFSPPLSSVPPLALAVLVSTVSCTAFGLALGAVAMRARDVFVLSNLAVYLMWIFCGVNIPLSALPGAMATVGRGLPMTHGIAAARRLVAGASLGQVRGQLLAELVVAAAWSVAAYALLRVFELEGRRRAALDVY